MQHIGKLIIVAGVVLIIAGAIIYFFGNRFGWFGNLPGDIKVEKEGFKFFAPLTSMILVSVALSLVLYLLNKFSK